MLSKYHQIDDYTKISHQPCAVGLLPSILQEKILRLRDVQSLPTDTQQSSILAGCSLTPKPEPGIVEMGAKSDHKCLCILHLEEERPREEEEVT